ncbi:hypothetical protein C8Q75DRAFT_730833 [Abortiporus biennis]|nr:hypothetical protein C8Q75DRAFT_730833 [Abortiporus biennis]
MSVIPLKPLRLASLFLTLAFGAIGTGVGINALVKSNNDKDLVRNNAPAGATVTINTDDIFDSGAVMTVVCGLITLATLVFFPLVLISRSPKLSNFTLPLQTGIYSFLSIWLFATLIPVTDFFANRQATVTAFVGTIPLPASIVQAAEESLGVTPVYHKIDYLRLAAILPWFTLLFSTITSVVSFFAWRISKKTAASTSTAERSSTIDEVDEKSPVSPISPVDEKKRSTEVSQAAV